MNTWDYKDHIKKYLIKKYKCYHQISIARRIDTNILICLCYYYINGVENIKVHEFNDVEIKTIISYQRENKLKRLLND